MLSHMSGSQDASRRPAAVVSLLSSSSDRRNEHLMIWLAVALIDAQTCSRSSERMVAGSIWDAASWPRQHSKACLTVRQSCSAACGLGHGFYLTHRSIGVTIRWNITSVVSGQRQSRWLNDAGSKAAIFSAGNSDVTLRPAISRTDRVREWIFQNI